MGSRIFYKCIEEMSHISRISWYDTATFQNFVPPPNHICVGLLFEDKNVKGSCKCHISLAILKLTKCLMHIWWLILIDVMRFWISYVNHMWNVLFDKIVFILFSRKKNRTFELGSSLGCAGVLIKSDKLIFFVYLYIEICIFPCV